MSRELPLFLIDAGELLQHVSRVVYRGSPLYYGRSGTNRYDDPARTYGVLYLGRDLPTALMESVFHKHQWLADEKRSIALKEVESRLCAPWASWTTCGWPISRPRVSWRVTSA